MKKVFKPLLVLGSASVVAIPLTSCAYLQPIEVLDENLKQVAYSKAELTNNFNKKFSEWLLTQTQEIEVVYGFANGYANQFVKPSDFELIKQPKPNGVWVQDNSKDFNDYFDYELTSYQGLYRIYRLTTKELQLRFYLERENGVMYEGFWKTTINPNLTLYFGAL